MSISFGYELFQGYPVGDDGVSFGSVGVNNVSPQLEIQGLIVSAGLTVSTVTLTIKGLPVGSEPFPSVTAEDFGTYTFTFRDTQYTLSSTSRGPKVRVGTAWIYLNWSCTGIDASAIKLSI